MRAMNDDEPDELFEQDCVCRLFSTIKLESCQDFYFKSLLC